MFAIRHIPGLFVAATQAFGGPLPLPNANWARWPILEFGLPERIATSQPAQAIMMISGARTSVIGLAMLIFHYQQKWAEFDLMMLLLGSLVGLIDGYVCWAEGVPGRAVFRATSGAVIAAWGWFGLHAGQ